MEKVQILPPPKDVDPRSLAWKGACVLAKMESVNDMWVTPSDWVSYVSSLFHYCLATGKFWATDPAPKFSGTIRVTIVELTDFGKLIHF
jgi:hypothetical protein